MSNTSIAGSYCTCMKRREKDTKEEDGRQHTYEKKKEDYKTANVYIGCTASRDDGHYKLALRGS